MKTWVYKSSRKDQTYLYVDKKDDFQDVPQGLLDLLGDLQFVIDVELHEGRKLAQVKASDVMKQIQETGYFLQMPPGDKGAVRPC